LTALPLVTGFPHVGIAVSDLARMLAVLQEMGFELVRREELPAYGGWSNVVGVGEHRLELLEASRPGGAFAQYLERHGPGLHHLCLSVRDIEESIALADRLGLRLVQRTPMRDSDGLRVFLHPSSMQGVLVGLVQPQDAT
jgi:methylmalonyl-CoA epimerase